MPRTEVRSEQIKDDGICREDINITIAGRSLIRKIIAGINISLSSTGADSGTGDVTVSLVSNPSVTSITIGNISITTNVITSDTGTVGLSSKLQLETNSARAPLNIPRNGTATPTTTVSGDIWYRSSNLYYNDQGTARTIAHTGSWSAISEAEIIAGTATTERLITAARLQYAFNNKTMSASQITAGTFDGTYKVSGSLAVGHTGTPSYIIDAIQNQNGATRLSIKNATSGTAAQTMLQIENNTGNVVQVGLTSSAYTGAGAAAGEGYIQTNTGSMFIQAIGANNYVRIGTNSGEKMRVLDSGRVAINRTDANYTVDVNGDINCSGVFRKGGIAGTSGTLIVFDEDYNRYQLTFSGGLLTELIFL